jgi:tetratricopeptide (TPR) repeat protein
MAVSPWLVLRQAQEALAAGRLDDAHRQLEPLLAEGHRRAYKLAREVVKAYLARARQALDQHNPEAAWRDLLAAEALNTGERAVAELRQTLAKLAIVQVRAMLEAGRPLDALNHITKYRDYGVRHPDWQHLEGAAQDWLHAQELADQGEFLRALAELERLAPRLPSPKTGFERFCREVETRHAHFRDAVNRLYDAAEAKQWREAVALAAEVLAVAPEYREAKVIRGKAWMMAVPETVELQTLSDAGHPSPASPRTARETRRDTVVPLRSNSAGVVLRSSHRGGAVAMLSSTGGVALPKRFLLWVDGIGGYLVCLSQRVSFGQATAEAPVDVPLFADVSRAHAEVIRDGEGYLIESNRGIRLNGCETKRGVLAAGDRVTLGSSCQFLFHKPVPVSSSARLELTSGHRLPVAVDSVLLMGNELILGPGPEAHIEIPHLHDPVLIYRSKDGLAVRVPARTFTVEDNPYHDRAILPLPAVVSCETFTFAVEPVSNRL